MWPTLTSLLKLRIHNQPQRPCCCCNCSKIILVQIQVIHLKWLCWGGWMGRCGHENKIPYGIKWLQQKYISILGRKQKCGIFLQSNTPKILQTYDISQFVRIWLIQALNGWKGKKNPSHKQLLIPDRLIPSFYLHKSFLMLSSQPASQIILLGPTHSIKMLEAGILKMVAN